LVAAARGQSAGSGAPVDEVDRFLVDAGTSALRAEHLERARAVGGPEGARAAETLAVVYAELLQHATGAELALYSLRASALLAEHRELTAMPLRLVLATGRFAQAEQRAEAKRLGIRIVAGADGQGEAGGDAGEAADRALGEDLAQLADEFATLSEIAKREASREEDRQRAARVRGRAASDDARQQAERLRLTGRYYEGWCQAHLATLGLRADGARRGLRAFSAVLDTEERELALDRLPREVLRYEQAARAAVGIAICHDAMGEHAVARAWLDAVIEAPETDVAARALALHRGLELALRDARFTDAARLAALVREQDADRTLGAAALPAAARGLAFLSGIDAAHASWQTARALTASALADLVRLGRTGEVLALLDAYPRAPIENAGFVADYLRGLRTLRQTQERQAALGEPTAEPTADARLAAEYRGAAQQLGAAARADDAPRFPAERIGALLGAAQATFLSGELTQAAAAFDLAAKAAADPTTRQNALWMRVICLDRLASGSAATPAMLAARDDAARAFLRDFPESPRAASLLMRLAGRDLVPVEQAVDLLSAVPAGSEAAPAARRQLAVLLFQWWGRATGAQRAELAARLQPLNAELAEEDLAQARAGREDARGTAIIRARQVIEVALASDPPDTPMARRAARVLIGVETARPSEDLRAEITYHAVRIAIAEGDGAAVASAAVELRRGSGPYRVALARVLLAHAARRAQADAGDLDAARTVYDAARVLLDAPASELSPAARAATREHAAAAAATLFLASREAAFRDAAIEFDAQSLAAGGASPRTLRRHAGLLESAGRIAPAADAWLKLLAASSVGTPEWFEARVESLRLLAQVEPARARAALAQHRALYPDLGPQPWRTRLVSIAAALDRAPEPASEPAPEATP
jgi:hypothetical protein